MSAPSDPPSGSEADAAPAPPSDAPPASEHDAPHASAASPRDALVDALRDALGPEAVATDPEVLASCAHDLTGRWHGAPRCLLRPRSTAQVARAVAACAAHGVPVVAQGGNTGLVGGQIPTAGEACLSLARLDDLEPVDVAAGEVVVGAGAVLSQVQQHVRRSGLDVPVDHGGRWGATIGGMVATNAGGARAVRHGLMRAHVRGLEAVLADGRVLRRLAGLRKDNTGYDLVGLLAGSEGTLGVITRVRLGLVPWQPRRLVALVGLPDLDAALALLAALRARAPELLEAADFLHREGLALVRDHHGLPAPLAGDWPVLAVVELAGPDDRAGALESALEHALTAAGADPEAVAVADAPAQREALWTHRDGLNEAIAARGVPVKLDVSVPPGALASVPAAVADAVAAVDPAATTLTFGHLGDGNVHVNVLSDHADEAALTAAVLELVLARGGSVAAEHGVGVAKRGWVARARDPVEVDALRALKAALDPHGVLAPGRLVP